MRSANIFEVHIGLKCIVSCTLAVACFAQSDQNSQAGFATVGAPSVGSHPFTTLTGPSVRYVQGNYATPQTPQQTVKVTFKAAQAAGNLNVIVVGWNDSTAVVNSVTDTHSNTYNRAIGPSILSGSLSQSIYYAKNIAAAGAAANVVTVNFSAAAVYPDIRILEYTGADPNNPVDVTAARSGNSLTSSSGAATTTNPTDLIFGANIVATYTNGPGSGFRQRTITSPDGDIAEDKMVTASGSYSANAPLSSAGPWIMQMVAFRTPSLSPSPGGDTTPPTAPGSLAAAAGGGQINLSWTASSDPDSPSITYHVERCQGAGCTSFAQIATPTATTYSDTGLAPGNYSYRVRASDPTGNLSSYSNVATGTIADTTPPTAPANLAATAVSTSQINLTWTASTDNVGVTGYLIERCQGAACASFAQVATTASTTLNDTSLAANTSYSYRVRATDAAGNVSSYSNVATANTQQSTGTLSITPTSTNFGDVPLGSNSTQSVVLKNTGASNITISQANVAGNEFSMSAMSLPLTLTAGQNTGFNVVFTPSGAGGVTGSVSLVSNATNSPTADALSGTGIHIADLSWQASTSSVAGYNVYRGTVSGGPYTKLNTSLVGGTTYSDMTIQAGQTYYYVATAVDSSNNESLYSTQASAVVPTP
jgi:fibronectin type 3 domain-containing protein